jgi:Flp pilus assembly protein TadG
MIHLHRSQEERGTAMVEMALLLPVVMGLMLGIFTGGSAYFRKISLVDASRDGARYGASLKVPAEGLVAWRQAVRARVAEQSGGEISAGEVCAELVVPTGSDLTCGVKDPAGAATDPNVLSPASLVKVAVVKPTKLEFLYFGWNVDLGAKVAARYERDIL